MTVTTVGELMETNNKLREALTKILNLTNSLDENCAVDPVEIRDIAKAALAAPPRNCDVGTVQEQTERFKAFCQSNMQFYKDMFGHDDEGRLDGWDCREDCPVGRMIDSGTAVADHCQLAWAQMPYEAESKAEAKRKFNDYTREGANGWDSAGVSTRVEEIEEGGDK